MDKAYWDNYYEVNSEPFSNSPFSNFVINQIEENKSLLDIGCGNGRDSIFFAKNKINTLGIDQSDVAVNNLKKYENRYLNFENTKISKLKDTEFDYGYCRFLLHSIDKKSEKYLMNFLNKNIKNSIFLETRVLNNRKEIDSSNMNHYRRIESENYYVNLFKDFSFKLIYKKTSYNFSKYRNAYNVKDIKDNPLILRLVLKKDSGV